MTIGAFHSVPVVHGMEATGALVQFDDVLDALGDIQRRKLLVALLEHNPQSDSPAVVETSPDELAEIEDPIEMRHVHLPKLVEHGLIEWDKENNEVSKGPDFVEIRPLLELLDDHAEELPEGWR